MSTNFDRDGPLIVHVGIDEIYHFGKVNKKGWREVWFENGELEFDRCRIHHLIKGDPMTILFMDEDGLSVPFTTEDPATYIKQEEAN